MMSIYELGKQYENEAKRLDIRIGELMRLSRKHRNDESIIRRIAGLRQMRDETNESAKILKTYYDKLPDHNCSFFTA